MGITYPHSNRQSPSFQTYILLKNLLHVICFSGNVEQVETQSQAINSLQLLSKSLHSFVQVLVQEENYPEAIKHLLSYLKHCKESHGDFTPQVCDSMHLMANPLFAAAYFLLFFLFILVFHFILKGNKTFLVILLWVWFSNSITGQPRLIKAHSDLCKLLLA